MPNYNKVQEEKAIELSPLDKQSLPSSAFISSQETIAIPKKWIYMNFGLSISAFLFGLVGIYIALYSEPKTIYLPSDNRGTSTGGNEQEKNTCVLWDETNITSTSQIPGYNVQMGTVVTPSSPYLGWSMEDGYKVFHLYAQPITQEFFSYSNDLIHSLVPPSFRFSQLSNFSDIYEFSAKLFGYNGHSPGPLLEVNQFDKVKIILHNELKEPTSIHFHGLELPWHIDGVGGLNQRPVMPGEVFEYKFEVELCGTFMYHSGTLTAKQNGMGLNGPFVSHCQNISEPTNDFFLHLQSFSIHKTCPELFPRKTNWHLFNGHCSPSISPLIVNEKQKVKIRFSNVQDEYEHPIHIDGHKVWQTAIDDGGIVSKKDKTHTSSTVVISPGKIYDIFFEARPGLWRLYCHIPQHMVNRAEYLRKNPEIFPHDGGMLTYLCVRGMTENGYMNCTNF